jgi:hypothetical protein
MFCVISGSLSRIYGSIQDIRYRQSRAVADTPQLYCVALQLRSNRSAMDLVVP